LLVKEIIMHVSGVKQEQPDNKPKTTGPLVAKATIRDARNTKIAEVSEGDPRRVIGILNTLISRKTEDVFVDTSVYDGERNRILKIKGEGNPDKVIRILKHLMEKSRTPKGLEEVDLPDTAEVEVTEATLA
jgi:hypothetical protein